MEEFDGARGGVSAQTKSEWGGVEGKGCGGVGSGRAHSAGRKTGTDIYTHVHASSSDVVDWGGVRASGFRMGESAQSSAGRGGASASSLLVPWTSR